MLPDIINFNKICRTCLVNASNMRFIFKESNPSDNHDKIQLSMLLRTCISITATPKDKLPLQVCEECFNSLQDYYKFLKKCEKSERILLEVLEQHPEFNHKDHSGEHINESNVEDHKSLDGATKQVDEDCDNLAKIKLETDEGIKEEVETVLNNELNQSIPNGNLSPHQLDNNREMVKEKCSICSMYFSSDSECKNHRELNHSQEYVCQICMKKFRNREGLRKHMFIHQPVKTHKCDQCGKSFRRSDYLSRHQKLHREEDQNSLSSTCSICNKRLSTPGALHIHMKRHQNVRDYICTYCGKCFITKTSLIIHERTHTDERPYKCDICGKCFVQNTSLSNHMNIHTGKKPYECTECGQRCFTKSHLTLHMRIHTGERPHKCIVCSKAFRVPGYLKEHMKFHTSDYEFFCSYCNKGFHLSAKLKNHMRMHTGEKPFPCTVCGKKFSQSTYRYIHMKNMHKDKLTKSSQPKSDGIEGNVNT